MSKLEKWKTKPVSHPSIFLRLYICSGRTLSIRVHTFLFCVHYTFSKVDPSMKSLNRFFYVDHVPYRAWSLKTEESVMLCYAKARMDVNVIVNVCFRSHQAYYSQQYIYAFPIISTYAWFRFEPNHLKVNIHFRFTHPFRLIIQHQRYEIGCIAYSAYDIRHITQNRFEFVTTLERWTFTFEM